MAVIDRLEFRIRVEYDEDPSYSHYVCADGDYVLYTDHLAALAAATEREKALVEALEAMVIMSDAGEQPRKFDEALSWRDNDLKARRLADAALALVKEERG